MISTRYKRQLTLSGLRNEAYWIAKFITDWSCYVLIAILAVIFAAAFDTEFAGNAFGAFVVCLFLSQVS